MQKIMIVTGYWTSRGEWKDTSDAVNKLLNEGWTVVSQSPMGAYGFGFAGGETDYYNSSCGFAAIIVLQKV